MAGNDGVMGTRASTNTAAAAITALQSMESQAHLCLIANSRERYRYAVEGFATSVIVGPCGLT
uniref:Uncharacterized protein n=1 Tax=Anguilla anguilla TaxID=7936 RepID=A0A0E9U8B7_ANGAN